VEKRGELSYREAGSYVTECRVKAVYVSEKKGRSGPGSLGNTRAQTEDFPYGGKG